MKSFSNDTFLWSKEKGRAIDLKRSLFNSCSVVKNKAFSVMYESVKFRIFIGLYYLLAELLKEILSDIDTLEYKTLESLLR